MRYFLLMITMVTFLVVGKRQVLAAPKLSAVNAKFRDLVVPNASEASYRKIPWRTSILQGIVEAQKHDKPVMIYLMNGHPLGCT